ncbi:MAG: chloride channel protein, partial [Eggerthella sp.]|nr:chloride channel protein [Eggerthella sp.]
LCIRFGWRGGHFFPVIFAGIAIGYGMATLTGADPVFCLCACTAALVGGVMRQPLMTVLLLFLCFPVKGIVVMLAAAALGAAVPLPKALRAEQAEG